MLFGKKGELVRLSFPRYFQWRNFADCFKNDSNTNCPDDANTGELSFAAALCAGLRKMAFSDFVLKSKLR